MTAILIDFALGLIERLPQIIGNAQRTGELTQEQADAYSQRMDRIMAGQAWATDEQIAAAPNN